MFERLDRRFRIAFFLIFAGVWIWGGYALVTKALEPQERTRADDVDEAIRSANSEAVKIYHREQNR